jgi:hypothetical protein
MIDTLYNFFYYGTITNILNIAVFAAIEYLSDEKYFIENMQEYGISIGMYALEKYNIIHKKYFEPKNSVKERISVNGEDKYFLLKIDESYISEVETPDLFVYTKNHVNVILSEGIYYEMTDSINIDDLKHLDTDIGHSLLSVELRQNEQTFDVKELLPYCLYDGMTLSDGLLKFLILHFHNYSIITDDNDISYELIIIDGDADKNLVNLKERYVVFDRDREKGFFTLSK